MLESILADVVRIFQATFLTGDWIRLSIAIGSAFVAALMMQRATQIGSMTLLSLVFFVAGGFAFSLFGGARSAEGAGATGARAAAQIEASWSQFMNMQAGTLLAYFLAFMLFILIIFALKSVIRRA